MFDFAWSEIALIAAVALIAIGPKDMPAAIRAVSNTVKKARKMAAEFQTHVDEMVREANLDEVKSQFNEIRNFDVRSHIEKAVDSDGSLRSTFAGNPLEPSVSSRPAETIAMPMPDEITVPEAPNDIVIAPPDTSPEIEHAPPFIPPGMVPPPEVQAAATAEPEPPAFIPPSYLPPPPATGADRPGRTSPSA